MRRDGVGGSLISYHQDDTRIQFLGISESDTWNSDLNRKHGSKIVIVERQVP